MLLNITLHYAKYRRVTYLIVCCRYGFTVLANLAVSLSMWQLLDHVKNTGHSSGNSNSTVDLNSTSSSSTNKINPGDKGLFWVQWNSTKLHH